MQRLGTKGARAGHERHKGMKELGEGSLYTLRAQGATWRNVHCLIFYASSTSKKIILFHIVVCNISCYILSPRNTCRSLDYSVFNILFLRVLQIILVDGNIAVGKNEFARKLANAFDLRYYPSVSPERVYLDLKKTYDLRELNEVLPDSCRVKYFLSTCLPGNCFQNQKKNCHIFRYPIFMSQL